MRQRAGRRGGCEDDCPVVPSSQGPTSPSFKSIISNDQWQRDDCHEITVTSRAGQVRFDPGNCGAPQYRTLLPAASDAQAATRKLRGWRGRSQRCRPCYIFWKCFFKTNVYGSPLATSYKLVHASNVHGSNLKQHVQVDLPFLDSKKPVSISMVPRSVQPQEIPVFSRM